MNLTLFTFVALGGGVLLFGGILGYFLRVLLLLGKKGSMELTIKTRMVEAESKASRIVTEAGHKANDLLEETKRQIAEKESQLHKLEERLLKKDELLDKRQVDIDKEVEGIKQKIVEVKELKERLEKSREEAESKLASIAKLSESEAKEELFRAVEKKSEEDIMVRMQKFEIQAEEKLDRRAKDILATCIQRVANGNAAEVMTTSLPIPSDEVKGKIIGKEGRNIRAFERVTGVEVLIDDTPGVIVLSSFDSVRRHVARAALDTLIKDGRIQPARIEEVVEKAKKDLDKIMREKAEAALVETGLFNLDPRLVAILGRLHFRTSYGQNVLVHSTEMAHLAGMLATELGADVQVAKTGALLHDIGKAVDHEVQGTHVEIGRKILQKFGVDNKIVQAMQSHHEEYPYETLESIIVQTADAISGGRPGARRDSVENYLKRLTDLEALANNTPGVEKSYAIAAGREIRVFVNPQTISDLDALKMAQDLARRIEAELRYPGEIKVCVIRETRVIEHAR
ncbi:MAG: ribonuclease Y [Parcubacteria group bacterium RIFCSPHIGHO2_01_FULL_45_26]|nr:MAG: ribonuclease Y [Parcubacteria group bacterium RIFCSPHIGHO2_01_FULL_45_26]